MCKLQINSEELSNIIKHPYPYETKWLIKE